MKSTYLPVFYFCFIVLNGTGVLYCLGQRVHAQTRVTVSFYYFLVGSWLQFHRNWNRTESLFTGRQTRHRCVVCSFSDLPMTYVQDQPTEYTPSTYPLLFYILAALINLLVFFPATLFSCLMCLFFFFWIELCCVWTMILIVVVGFFSSVYFVNRVKSKPFYYFTSYVVLTTAVSTVCVH